MDPLLAANFEEVISLIITLAIIGFSVLSQVLGSGDKAKKQQEARRRQQQQKQQQKAQGAARPQANSIESEIEAFLRQARGEAPPQAPAVQPIADEPVRKLVNEPMEVQPIEVEPIEPGRGFGRDLATHVQDHIGNDSISQRDAQLGDHVELADERIEQHLEEVFDHEVGHLAHFEHVDTKITDGTDAVSWEEAVEKASMASDIAAMMKSPDSLRKMFIVTEIFRRPEI